MASSSVSQDDHDVEHEFAIASRRAKVRSARANRAVNTLSCRGLGEEVVEQGEEGGSGIPKFEPATMVFVESSDASPKPVVRGLNAKEKRVIPRGAHAGKNNKGVRDCSRRKLREKRRSTTLGVMHLPSTESTGGSTGEDENDENSTPPSIPVSKLVHLATDHEDASVSAKSPGNRDTGNSNMGKSESDLDADDEAAQDSSEVNQGKDTDAYKEDPAVRLLKIENQRLQALVEAKDRRIAMLEVQVSTLSKQVDEIRDKLLHQALGQPSGET